jgi:hypothetical protein
MKTQTLKVPNRRDQPALQGSCFCSTAKHWQNNRAHSDMHAMDYT